MSEKQTKYEVKKLLWRAAGAWFCPCRMLDVDPDDMNCIPSKRDAIDLAMQLLEYAGWQPMETAPRDKPVLLNHKKMWGLQIGIYSKAAKLWDFGSTYVRDDDNLIGWLPLPKMEVGE